MFLQVTRPFEALCYPLLLKAFHASVTAPRGGLVFVSTILLGLALAVPVFGVYVSMKLATIKDLTVGELQAKRVALLVVALPTLYTFLGVFLSMTGNPISDISLWSAMWVLIGIFAIFAGVVPGTAVARLDDEVSPRLRMAHGARRQCCGHHLVIPCNASIESPERIMERGGGPFSHEQIPVDLPRGGH